MHSLEEHVEFESCGCRIEGILAYPDAGRPRLGVLMLGPHPHLGGNMHNNVLRHLARRLGEEGALSLRFNYRGVGGSEIELPAGNSVFDFYEDMENEQCYEILLPECLAAGNCVRELGEDLELMIIGYSLGAVVAPLVAREWPVQRILAISPPISKVPLDAYRNCEIPRFFLCGDQDFTFDTQQFDAFYESLPGIKHGRVLRQSDHFFRKEEERVYEAVADFVFQECPAAGDGGRP